MPWKELRVMDVREEFVLKASAPGANVSLLCQEAGISRKTGHKWLNRYRQGGVEALADLSRRPYRIPKSTDGEMVLKVIEARHAYPKWGPKKLRAILKVSKDEPVPTVKTISRILQRAGEPQIRPRRKKRSKCSTTQAPRVEVTCPNTLWTVDFKGWWRTRDGKRCEPLTVRDAFSKLVLCAQAVPSTSQEVVKPIFQKLFEQYGLPDFILVDNGPPFSSITALHGLTRLSAWWVALGIQVIRSRPGCPQDNGAHERMHRDIREEVELFPADNVEIQQQALNRWMNEFNCIRPHEALAMKVPADIYQRSKMRYRGVKRPCYPQGMSLRRVDKSGHIHCNGDMVFLTGSLAGYDVGLEPLEDGTLVVWFYKLRLLNLALIDDCWRVMPEPEPPPRLAEKEETKKDTDEKQRLAL